MGHAAKKIYSSFQLATVAQPPVVGANANAAATVANANNFNLVMKWFNSYVIPKCNVIHKR